jgi:hypothetical protein
VAEHNLVSSKPNCDACNEGSCLDCLLTGDASSCLVCRLTAGVAGVAFILGIGIQGIKQVLCEKTFGSDFLLLAAVSFLVSGTKRTKPLCASAKIPS